MSSTGFVYTEKGQRAAQFLFPPNTRAELAQRALEVLVPRWVENLRTRENLVLKTDIDIQGPFVCPWLESFGEDMWIASGLFTSSRMREVDEDFLWASREIASEQGIVRDPHMHRVLPRDFRRQMQFISENTDKVYDDVRSSFKALDAAREACEV